MPFGGGSLKRNMGMVGVVGAQNWYQGHMVLVCGNQLEVVVQLETRGPAIPHVVSGYDGGLQ